MIMKPASQWYDCATGKVGDWYIGKGWFGGRMVAYSYLKHCRRIPFWLGRAYDRQELRAVVYYPVPLNYVARWLRAIWWSTDRVLYWVGLIDVSPGECFNWHDFWRIKSKRSNVW